MAWRSALPFILEALKPLRDAGYLTTYYFNGTIVPSAITVIGTGNSPLDLVEALDPWIISLMVLWLI